MADEHGQRAAEQKQQVADLDKTIPKVDATKPHPARIYDYWLGGCSL